jgi:rfaE bifunctional protein kinase chain/domain/rfaE bifunctional protein nucleotidyltransferase chain/domain
MVDKKIVELDELVKVCKDKKKQGEKIVLSHGCFDLLHPGHIRHLKAAKKFGDTLVVMITPDKYVKKGPNRPVFNEHLRAESVASLVNVDLVSLSKWDVAVKAIELIEPDFYVRGRDYSDSIEDFTSTIMMEENAIKKINGEMKYTNEITFSSSSIINEQFDVLSKEAKTYINTLKNNFESTEIIQTLKNLDDLKVLVIGDVILDEYIFCKAMGKPEKAAVVSTKFLYDELYTGGSLAIANHIAGFVKKVDLVSCLGKDDKESFIKETIRDNIKTTFFNRKHAPTIRKTRYIEKSEKSKLFEISHMNDDYLEKDLEKSFIKHLETTIADYDMVLIADFGHGLITPSIQDTIIKHSKYTAVNAQTNSANFGFNFITKFKNIDYISIDERELRLPYRAKFGDIEPLLTKVSHDTNCKRINITLGKSGSIYYEHGKTYYVPIFSTNVVDSVGAGDAVLAITSLLSYKNVNPKLIPFVGNVVGSLAVKTMGNKEPINPMDLFTFIKYIMK